VEADFIDSIRGLKPVTLTNFDDGVRYMEFVEAVTLSMQSGEAVSLPL
jgi:predicted dehydrogenase